MQTVDDTAVFRPLFQVDRSEPARVSNRVSSLFGTFSAVLLAAALAAGCGGKSKGAPAGPGTGSTAGMQSQGADTRGNVKNTGAGSATAGNGATAGGDTAGGDDAAGGNTAGGDTAGGDEQPPPPKAEPPVADISEAEAQKQAASHLQMARKALEGPKRSPDAAISAARDALSVDPNSVDAVVYLAHAYYFKKLYSTADVILLRALSSPNVRIAKKANKHAGVFYVRGLVYDATDEPQKAELAYAKAHELDPNHKGAMMNLGVHYIQDSRYADAQALFEKLVNQLGVRTPASWTDLGSCYRGRSASSSLGKQQRNRFLMQAESAYKRAVDMNKNYAPAYYDLGLLYMDASPFPLGGQNMDELKRMQRAKTYFDEYRGLPGAEINRVDEMLRKISKEIKKEEKRRKKAEKAKTKKNDDW